MAAVCSLYSYNSCLSSSEILLVFPINCALEFWNAVKCHLPFCLIATSMWTEFLSGSISDCPAITVPPTATTIAISEVRNLILLILPTSRLLWQIYRRASDEKKLFPDALWDRCHRIRYNHYHQCKVRQMRFHCLHSSHRSFADKVPGLQLRHTMNQYFRISSPYFY